MDQPREMGALIMGGLALILAIVSIAYAVTAPDLVNVLWAFMVVLSFCLALFLFSWPEPSRAQPMRREIVRRCAEDPRPPKESGWCDGRACKRDGMRCPRADPD